MPLNNHVYISDDERPRIVSEENKRKHIACNPGEDRVIHYKVDGVILINQKACDYILMNENENKKTAYLIELKGCRVDKAAEQLLSTAETLKEYLNGYKICFRIVSSKSPTHNVRSSSFRKLEEKLKRLGDFRMRTNEIEEDI